jgi:hypothetical protein
MRRQQRFLGFLESLVEMVVTADAIVQPGAGAHDVCRRRRQGGHDLSGAILAQHVADFREARSGRRIDAGDPREIEDHLPQLVADDPDPADIGCEDHAAGEDAKQKRLEKPALGCDQDDGEDNEPVARREAPAAADAPIPHEFGSELDQQSPQDEARDITYHLSAAHQHSQVRVPPRTRSD